MAKSYLIYERRTVEQLPVGIFDTVREAARFLGVSRQEFYNILAEKHKHKVYGIFCYDDSEE